VSNEKKSLSLAPRPELSLAEVLRAAREDCKDYLEIAFEGRLDVRYLFLAFEKVLAELSDAGTREAVNAAIYSHVEWCLAHDNDHSAAPSRIEPESVRFAEMRARAMSELSRIRAWVAVVYAKMEPLQQEKDEIYDCGQVEFQQERYDELQTSIKTFAELVEPFETDMRMLEHYLASLAVIERGVPRELFGKPFPELASAKNSPDAHGGSLAPPIVRPVPPASVPPVRMPVLAELTRSLGFKIPPLKILAFSLFDLFGPENSAIGGKQRGLVRTLDTAHALGILQSYGWPTLQDALAGQQWKDSTAGFLKFRGQMPGNSGPGMFVRSEVPLPWNSRALFTESEISEFLAMMRTPYARNS
jgi:hypothetical protein